MSNHSPAEHEEPQGFVSFDDDGAKEQLAETARKDTVVQKLRNSIGKKRSKQLKDSDEEELERSRQQINSQYK